MLSRVTGSRKKIGGMSLNYIPIQTESKCCLSVV